METFSPKGNICGPIMPKHVLKLSISHGAKLLYALLCNHAGEKDHCWPSHALLADEVGCSVSSVKSYLKELQSEKLIRVRSERYQTSTYYMLKPVGLPSSSSSAREPNSAYPRSDSGYRNNLRNSKDKFPPSPRQGPSVLHSSPLVQRHNMGRGDFLSANSVFEKFWSAYPRKEAKELARSVWHRLSRSGQLPGLNALLAALEKFKASAMWMKEHGRFVPQLVNWLKGQRWLDEVPADAMPAPEEKARHEEVKRLNAHFEEKEKKRKAALQAETALLRPAFTAFLSRFDDGEKMRGPAWGLWCVLHGKGKAPCADQVPAGYSGGILNYLRECTLPMREGSNGSEQKR